MRYVLFSKGQVVYATNESPFTGTLVLAVLKRSDGSIIEYDEAKNDFKSFAEVENVASVLNNIMNDGLVYLAFDNGSGTSRRYGVMIPPKVGDDVSYCFNGDYYPCGKVIRITKGWRIYTSDDTKLQGSMFNRKGQTSNWVMKGGTWSLVKGIVNRSNPSF